MWSHGLASRNPRGGGKVWAWQMYLLAEACAWFLWRGHGPALRALGGTRKELFGHVRSGVGNFLVELAQFTKGSNKAKTVPSHSSLQTIFGVRPASNGPR